MSYRSDWINNKYKPDMASAEACPPPSRDSGLIRIYYLTKAEHAESNLNKKRLKVSTIDDLNDPFELLCLSQETKKERDLSSKIRGDISSSEVLICFTEDWGEPVMWGHYADRFSGVCLGFDIREDRLIKMEYENSRLSGDGDRTEIIRRTKSKGWAYENERRLYLPKSDALSENNHYFMTFEQLGLALKEVILGPKIDPNELTKFRKLAGPEVTTYQARLAFRSFKVVPQKMSLYRKS